MSNNDQDKRINVQESRLHSDQTDFEPLSLPASLVFTTVNKKAKGRVSLRTLIILAVELFIGISMIAIAVSKYIEYHRPNVLTGTVIVTSFDEWYKDNSHSKSIVYVSRCSDGYYIKYTNEEDSTRKLRE